MASAQDGADVDDPSGPPALDKMQARIDTLEAERAESFEAWKAALEAADGAVTQAALETLTHLPESSRRNRGNYLTRKLGLQDYASTLRQASGGHAGAGRPKTVK